MHVFGIRRLFGWALSSPFFLFLASAILFFHKSWDLWPFALLAVAGLFSIYRFYRLGFYGSFFAMLLFAGIQYETLLEKPFCALFLIGMVVSWAIALLSQEELGKWIEAQSKSWQDLEEKKKALEEEVLSYQRKEGSLLKALDDAQLEISKQKQNLISLQSQEQPLLQAATLADHSTPELSEPVQSAFLQEEQEDLSAALELKILERKHLDLQRLFEQKSIQLNEARQQLFQMEGENFLLQTEKKEYLEIDEGSILYQNGFNELLDQYEDLQWQVEVQEEIISSLSLKKKAKTPRKPKTLSERIKAKQYSLLD